MPNESLVNDLIMMSKILKKIIHNLRMTSADYESVDPKLVKAMSHDIQVIVEMVYETYNMHTKNPTRFYLVLTEMWLTMESFLKVGILFQKHKLATMSKHKRWIRSVYVHRLLRGKLPQPYCCNPTNRDTAIYMGWTGWRCKCKSWKTEAVADGLACCLDCHVKFQCSPFVRCHICHMLLYGERIKRILAAGGRCYNCEKSGVTTTLDLPPEFGTTNI